MKRLIKFGSIGLGFAAAIASQEVSAQNLYRGEPITVKGVASHRIYGATDPRIQFPIEVSGLSQKTKQFRVNSCGHTIIPDAATYGTGIKAVSKSSTTPVVNIASALSQSQILYACSNGISTLGGPFLSSGAANIGGGAIVVSSYKSPSPSGGFVDFIYSNNETTSRFLTTNACGVGSATLPAASLVKVGNLATAPVRVADLPLAIGGLRCSGNSVLGALSSFSSAIDPLPELFKDSSNNIYLKGAANSSVPIALQGAASTRTATSDRCGGLTVGSASSPIPGGSSFTVDSEVINTTGYTLSARPSCRLLNGVYSYEVPPSSNHLLSNGAIFLKNSVSKPSGFGDRTIYQIGTNGSSTRNIAINNCGFGVLRSPASNPFTAATSFIKPVGITVVVGSLPNYAAQCVNVGTSASPNYQTFGVFK